jgi:hypothetical protein
MAGNRNWRFTLAAACIAYAVSFLSGCISYHEVGQPYSGTAWWLRNAGTPWRCHCTAPNKFAVFAIGVPYTALVLPFAATTAIGETVILPVDHYYGVPELPLPPDPSCDAFWGRHASPGPAPPSEPPVYPQPEATPSAEPPPAE